MHAQQNTMHAMGTFLGSLVQNPCAPNMYHIQDRGPYFKLDRSNQEEAEDPHIRAPYFAPAKRGDGKNIRAPWLSGPEKRRNQTLPGFGFEVGPRIGVLTYPYHWGIAWAPKGPKQQLPFGLV